MKQQNAFILAILPLLSLIAVARGATVDEEIYQYQSSVTKDANGSLDLKAELNYDNTVNGAPISVVMHGYGMTSGVYERYRPNAQRLRDAGFFVLTVPMRSSEGSDGVTDSGGVEIYDIYDAVESVKADSRFQGLVDPTTVYITGYSGGGGNTMSALTKFPDYFRAGAAFFGMSDYGYDKTTGWYFNGADALAPDTDFRNSLKARIGDPTLGDPNVEDRYMARASNLAAKNNPYSEIHLFVNKAEGTASPEIICPPSHSTSYRDKAVAAASFAGEFDNITVHLGESGTYEDFDGDGVNDLDEQQWWPHTRPSAEQQNAAEAWFLERLLDGSIPEPQLNANDELFVAGYVKTKPFRLWLGDGQNAAAELTYSLSETDKMFALEIASNDKTVTGQLDVETADMAGRNVRVVLNGEEVAQFVGGETYQYTGLADGDVLRLVAAPEPETCVLLAVGAICWLATRMTGRRVVGSMSPLRVSPGGRKVSQKGK